MDGTRLLKALRTALSFKASSDSTGTWSFGIDLADAPDGGADSASSEVARRMNRAPGKLGPARASLIAKGLVYSPEHGRIAFTVPGMHAFIARQPAE